VNYPALARTLVALILPLALCGIANAQAAVLIVSPNALSFAVTGGDTGAFPQQLDVNSSGAPLTFTVEASSTGNWLAVIGSIPAGAGWQRRRLPSAFL
jgi:hypothetical protein